MDELLGTLVGREISPFQPDFRRGMPAIHSYLPAEHRTLVEAGEDFAQLSGETELEAVSTEQGLEQEGALLTPRTRCQLCRWEQIHPPQSCSLGFPTRQESLTS